ncbi:hypothetical protein ACQJBY_042736 [Aegilops geniculata]
MGTRELTRGRVSAATRPVWASGLPPPPTAALRRRGGASGQRPSRGSPTASPASPGGCRVRRGAGSQRIRVPGRARLAERDLRRGGGLLGHGGTAPPPPRWPSPWSPSSVVASVEEARLWHVVTVDCLDFDAGTILVEERERIAESNILKIRKVYDAFLAEFPLYFGYWKNMQIMKAV